MSTYDELVQLLVEAKISSPRLEARKMLAYVLQKDESDAGLLSASLSNQQGKLLQKRR